MPPTRLPYETAVSNRRRVRTAAAGVLLGAWITAATGTEIGVVGLFPGKAVLVVDGSAPKTFMVGKLVSEGVRLLGVTDEAATLSVHGKTEQIAIGRHYSRSTSGSGNGVVTLAPDSQGHYVASGQINGIGVRMMVDTGATLLCLPAADARRLGIDYRSGQPAVVNTANGAVAVFRIKLDSVRIGELELSQVDAVVQEKGLTQALLGMSFLSRTEMNRSGDQMTLRKRF